MLILLCSFCGAAVQAQSIAVDCVAPARRIFCNQNTDTVAYGKLFYFQFSKWEGMPTDPAQLQLYVNDVPLPYYQCLGINMAARKVFFSTELRDGVTDNSQKTIIEFLRNDLGNYRSVVKGLRFGVGTRNGNAVSAGKPVVFLFFNTITAVLIAVFGFIFFIIGFIILGKKNALNESQADDNKSLRKFQLAFWTLVVAFCYVSLWLVLKDAPLLPESVLGLLGIAVGTTAVSAIIPQGAKQTNAQSPPALQPFKGLLADTDNSLAVHKLQFWIFTLVFGIIFVYTALVELRIYDFSPQQLILMGVSAGGYLGMKALKAS